MLLFGAWSLVPVRIKVKIVKKLYLCFMIWAPDFLYEALRINFSTWGLLTNVDHWTLIFVGSWLCVFLALCVVKTTVLVYNIVIQFLNASKNTIKSYSHSYYHTVKTTHFLLQNHIFLQTHLFNRSFGTSYQSM